MATDDSSTGKSPAFQFYPKDFITDENVVCMSMPERGCYITLLCACWTEGTLPADPGRLARLCNMSSAAFRKLWPALEPCFRVDSDRPGRLIHPRLEREREKQAEFRLKQSHNGKRGGRPKANTNPGESQNNPTLSSGLTQTEATESSSIFNLQSAISDLQTAVKEPAADARSKRPLFKGSRFVVFEWQVDDLRKMLGPHFEAFDIHEWFFTLSAKADAAELVVPQRDGGKWLIEQTLAEAQRRGLAVATAAVATGKTAGNAAALARFVARGRA